MTSRPEPGPDETDALRVTRPEPSGPSTDAHPGDEQTAPTPDTTAELPPGPQPTAELAAASAATVELPSGPQPLAELPAGSAATAELPSGITPSESSTELPAGSAATAELPSGITPSESGTGSATEAEAAHGSPAGSSAPFGGAPRWEPGPPRSGPQEPPFAPPPPGSPPGGTTPPPGGTAPPPGGTEPPYGGGGGPRPLRLLRRSRSNRMGVGLCGGLGDYFGVDPVLFRVLIVVLSVFGGAGIVLYLAGWLVVPEEGAADSSLDRAVADLRRRRVPFVLAVCVAVVVAWFVAFSWWAPGGLFPAIVVAAVALFILAYRDDHRLRSAVGMPPVTSSGSGYRPTPPSTPTPDAWAAATATSPSRPAADPATSTATFAAAPTRTSTAPTDDLDAPTWPPAQATAPPTVTQQLRDWRTESRERRAVRRRRLFPVRFAIAVAILIDLLSLGVADAVHGIPFVTYFWSVGAIVVVGLVVGAMVRRTTWGSAVLLIPVIVGVIAFLGSDASLHDGNGDRLWRPDNVASLRSSYNTAFGRSQLDLTGIDAVSGTHHVDIVAGSGQVVLRLPDDVPIRVHADVHAGAIDVDGTELHAGINYERDVSTTASSTGGVIDIDVQLSTGQLTITRV